MSTETRPSRYSVWDLTIDLRVHQQRTGRRPEHWDLHPDDWDCLIGELLAGGRLPVARDWRAPFRFNGTTIVCAGRTTPRLGGV